MAELSSNKPERVSGKRDPALIALSHDHHRALAEALKLRRANEADAVEAAEGFLAFWNEHGKRHFSIEEELLLPAVADHCGSTDEVIVRVLTDHVEIRRRAAELEPAERADRVRLNELGDLLEAHVRLEERVLFQRMQELMSRDELDALGSAITSAEARADVTPP